jgi:hypothetical protein
MKFCEDLKEAIMEMDEMEGLRIQSELDKLRGSWTSLIDVPNNNNNNNITTTNGVISSLIDYPTNKRDRPLSRTLSNSLLDMTLAMNAPPTCKLRDKVFLGNCLFFVSQSSSNNESYSRTSTISKFSMFSR